MFLFYFLDAYINLVKYLQRVPLDVSINWCYLYQDAGKKYSEILNMRSPWKYSKVTNYRHMKNRKYNCSGPPAFKSQGVAYQSSQKLLHNC